MKKSVLLPLLLLLGMLPLRGQVTVWPGDANNNGVVNNIDLLYVGLGIGQQGPARNQTSIAFQPFQATPWPAPAIDSVDLAYLDCDGNGIINATDSLAISTNYGLSHLPPPYTDPTAPTGGDAPLLSLDIANDSIFFTNDTSLTIDILLGDTTMPADSLYGIAFTVRFDSAAIDSINFSIDGGFLNHAGAMRISRRIDDRIQFAFTRTNQNVVVGFGKIGSIGIVMDDNLRITQGFSLPFSIEDVMVFGLGATKPPIQTRADTLYAQALTHRADPRPVGLQVYPQPAADQLRLRSTEMLLGYAIYDLRGRNLQSAPLPESHAATIETDRLPAGTYLLQVRTPMGTIHRKIWLRPH